MTKDDPLPPYISELANTRVLKTKDQSLKKFIRTFLPLFLNDKSLSKYEYNKKHFIVKILYIQTVQT